ncbi:MAG TPA: tetratricopeptide repeat protein [Pyrinomonadaceae bacterium]|nr:tetratricopeptide repeat protein [Pyrinomonadaceae bacterium]
MSVIEHRARRASVVAPATIFFFVFTLLLACGAPPSLYAQGTANYAAEKQRALQLLENSKATEALPILERLSNTNPEDGEVMFYYGFATLAHSNTLKEASARRQSRIRARAAMLKAREVGYKSPLMDSILEGIPADGGEEPKYSENAEADAAMQQGEAAFVKGDLDAALAAYQRALTLDPKLYSAALFAGDMYFKKGQPFKAAEWYERAIAIDPDRETAYRYSASPLMEAGKLEEARARYIEAFIAEPYNRLTTAGLLRWAQAAKIELAHPEIDVPTSVTPLKDNKMTINISPETLDKDDGSAAWIAYGITRTAWAMDKFAKEFPNEKEYRHSLREEVQALSSVVEGVKTQTKEKKIKTLNPSLARLVKLHDEGLLEAYVLYARADRGIAQDYAEYRKKNRDKLRRYLVEYVTGKK